MSLGSEFNEVLHRQLGIYAAWPPVVGGVNEFEVGDYGVIRGGVFSFMGNLSRDFPGIPEIEVRELARDFPETEAQSHRGRRRRRRHGGRSRADEPAPTYDSHPPIYDIQSGRVRVVRGSGGLAFGWLPFGKVDASVTFRFLRDKTAWLKGPVQKSHQMVNILAAADHLRQNPLWREYYKVVSRVFIGRHCLFVAAHKKGTSLVFKGGANLFHQVEFPWEAKVALHGEFHNYEGDVFQSIGEEGVVGLGLFSVSDYFPELYSQTPPQTPPRKGSSWSRRTRPKAVERPHLHHASLQPLQAPPALPPPSSAEVAVARLTGGVRQELEATPEVPERVTTDKPTTAHAGEVEGPHVPLPPSGGSILIKTLTGKTITVDTVKPSDTVEDLNAKIRDQFPFPPQQQRLVFADHELEDRRTLAYYDVYQGAAIYLILCLRAGGSESNQPLVSHPVDGTDEEGRSIVFLLHTDWGDKLTDHDIEGSAPPPLAPAATAEADTSQPYLQAPLPERRLPRASQ
ncbi:unnamed protein product [Vitrella brassicaformis CCMP3155]|uniref:Ubiquitin-like domain-containing protein n=2 Tax=Vitrella brassicaformis TaxID=1169539 RepID=A0A0G4GVP6_VITBC|nr:unnamed protein product [Vitrella brassicaformis CCMP3155]|mmetsp:Transcript_10214/g.29500  ORF Transcript_10214/g.29500 Transcript_10214/m.29500 type:complete len:513 (-) Transcript_10214:533-2071(-)|eukprot:CEM34896.1 unnamed protein product [Vitrella brassicaformis CCMP3155]